MIDQKKHAVATRTERLPLTFDEITPEWMTRTLQLEYPGVEIYSIKPVAFSYGYTTSGEKFVRHIGRVEVEMNQAGRDAGLPTQLCIKGNWHGNQRSNPVNINEAMFYRFFASEMQWPVPQCFFIDWDDDAEGQQSVIIMEDLSASGGEFCTSARAISVDEMAKSLEGLALIHGTSWNHPQLEQQTWLQPSMGKDTATDDYWSMIPEYMHRFHELPERVAIFPRFMKGDPYNRLRSAWLQMCAYEQAYKGPLCLIHGDAHLGNSYARADGSRIWFDWQIARKGRPWRDIVYFLVGSITIEDRRKSERDLLKVYLDALSSQKVDVSFDEAWESYRRTMLWGLHAWQANLNAMEETMPPLERFCSAVDDLETASFYRFE